MIITYVFIVSNLTKSIIYLYSWQNYDKWGSRTEQTPRGPRLLAVIIVVLTNSCTFWLHTLLHNTIKCMCKFYSTRNGPASSDNNFPH